MRLLQLKDDGEFGLVTFFSRNTPRYAVLSHTWGADQEEVTFKDLLDGTSKTKPEYSKIRFCGQQAAKDGLQYFWVDTLLHLEMSPVLNIPYKCEVYMPP